MMKKLFLSFIYTLFIVFLMPTIAKSGNGQMMFVCTLTPDEVVPPASSAAQGLVTIMFAEDQKRMLIHGLFKDLSDSVISVKLYVGNPDENGTVLLDFTPFVHGNRLTGNADVPKDFYELANLFQIYIQVDTKSNPNGEIRGLFYLFSEYMFSVVATGDQVVPKVNSGGVGIGTVRISLPLSSLEYEISAFSLSGRVKSASIHIGSETENGPLLVDLGADDVLKGKTDSVELVQQIFDAAFLDQAYIIIVTANNPNGEIRGKLKFNDFIEASALLQGEQVVPPVNAFGKAYAYAYLNFPRQDTLSFELQYTGFGPIEARISNGEVGFNGIKMATLKETSSGNYTGKIPLSKSQLTAFLKDELYIEMTSVSNPNGEIRGQLINNLYHSFAFDMCSEQEVSFTTSKAYGAAFLAVNKSKTEMIYSMLVDSLKAADVTSVKMYRGLVGTQGPAFFDMPVPDPYLFEFVNIDAPIAANILNDLAYINIKTKSRVIGEIRGQVRKLLTCDFNVSTSLAKINDFFMTSFFNHDQLVLDIFSDQNTDITLSIVDHSGRSINSWVQNLQAGTNRIYKNVDPLPGGFYILNATEKGFNCANLKIVKP